MKTPVSSIGVYFFGTVQDVFGQELHLTRLWVGGRATSASRP